MRELEDPRNLTVLKSQIDAVSVEDIIVDDFPSLGPDDTVADATAVMKKTGYQDIPVTEGGNYLGMMRYDTVLRKKSAGPEAKVKGLMTVLPTLEKNTEITEIAEIMVEHNCRQLAVVSGKKVIGIVSRTQLIEIASGLKSMKDVKVWEIMTSPVVSCGENDVLASAVDTMRNLDVRTLPVTDHQGKLCGVIGMKEVIEHGWAAENKTASNQILVSSIAVTNVLSIDWEDDMETAADIMASKGISTLPVTDGDDVIGVLTEYDIIELISSCRERDQLYVQISGLPDEDKVYTDTLYDDIAAEINKISKICHPDSLQIHVSVYNEDGNRKKYSLTGKLFADGRTFNAKAVDWDLTKANNDLMKKLGAEIKDRKDHKVSLRKRK